MEGYFFVNGIVTLIVLALLKYGNGTSSVNYYLSCFGIFVWLIPYAFLAQIVPAEVLVEPLILKQSFLVSTESTAASNTSVVSRELLARFIILIALLIGAILFIKKIIDVMTLNSRIVSDPSLQFHKDLSLKHQVPVYSANGTPSGMLLGIRSPKIVFSKSITDIGQINLIICHEKKHLERKDNVRLVLLTLVESIFWWNPLVRVLADKNRFFIEALCDEDASKEFGLEEYIDGLTSLILFNHKTKQYPLNCAATSNTSNSIFRVKLLKENRKMTLKRKVTYALTICTALIAMTWNTLATPTDSKVENLDKQYQGTLVNFDLKIEDRESKEISTHTSQMSMWVDFDKKVSFELGGQYRFNFTVSDLEELAFFDIEIVEVSGSDEKVVANPRLKTGFKQGAVIEIDNVEVSPNAYYIKFNLERALRPE
ncbi:M56 family metallopeptidase [Glaciecola sp. MH2013]|uniref:M56 family metallopeptidase n=1 Tax=Glaciecola sp. MH2013 TaxID=2785524 RepID=UPI0018A094CF|nr:M56 family metallopeptidase [Glaciecola sp. MH2013]MBF7074188.1 M56 family metallopeptidase [Glaciecola sp. MH2013]